MNRKLVHSRDTLSPAVLALFEDLVRSGLDLSVWDADEMYQFFTWGEGGSPDRALAMYFGSGRSLWETTRSVLAWRFGDPRSVTSVLDFAAGYGRLTRFLAHHLGPDKVWAAEVQRDAVAVQESQLGVHGLVSTFEPADFQPGRRFDAIIVSSLFSHLPEETFHRWLRRLAGLLSDTGILLFSVHDLSLLPAAERIGGLVFRPSSESQRLPGVEYGSTWVSEAFVGEAIAADAPNGFWKRFPRGFVNFQDLYVVVPGKVGVRFDELSLPRQFDGFVERFAVDGRNRLRVSGWLADRACPSPPLEVLLSFDGTVRGRLDRKDLRVRKDAAGVLGAEAPQAWGFDFEVALGDDWDPSRRFSIDVRSGDEKTASLAAGSIVSYLLRSSRLDSLQLQNSPTERIGELQARFDEATRRIEWMQASRFWKLREKWWSLKRFLRRS